MTEFSARSIAKVSNSVRLHAGAGCALPHTNIIESDIDFLVLSVTANVNGNALTCDNYCDATYLCLLHIGIADYLHLTNIIDDGVA